MISIERMPSISIKFIVLIHWVLLIWAVLSPWSPSAYMLCNLSVLAIGVWAIADRQSVDALFMFMIMQLISIVVDIVVLSTYFDSKITTSMYRFSTGMCILNLILKPFSTVLLYQMYRDRGGEYNINFGPNAPSYDQIGDDSENLRGSSTDLGNLLHPPHPGAPQTKNQPLA